MFAAETKVQVQLMCRHNLRVTIAVCLQKPESYYGLQNPPAKLK